MNILLMVLVAAGGAVGAPLRYLIDQVIRTRYQSVLPWGTLVANITGCFLLGLLAGLPLAPMVTVLVGAGFCGALTTYSTFSYETLTLARNRGLLLAIANVFVCLALGLAACISGIALMTLVVS